MIETMPAIVQFDLKAGSVELREVSLPDFEDDEVLLRVGAVGVCGSDVHQWHGTQSWAVNVPVTLGHEFGGTIEKLGARVEGFAEGDRVVSETAARICGACVYCRGGNYNMCPHRSGFGYGCNGAMAQFVRVSARCLHHIPISLPFEIAALTEPCCVAYNAVVEGVRIKPGDGVLVLGPGPIGLLSAMMAMMCGGDVTVAGLSSDSARLEVAKSLGAHTYDLQTGDIRDLAKSRGDGFGFDVVIDAAGASAAFATAMDAVRPLGQIVKVGWGPQPLGVSLDPLVAKAVTVRGSFSHNYAVWERAIALLASGKIDVKPLVGLQLSLEQWRDGFEGMHAGHFAKALLVP